MDATLEILGGPRDGARVPVQDGRVPSTVPVVRSKGIGWNAPGYVEHWNVLRHTNGKFYAVAPGLETWLSKNFR